MIGEGLYFVLCFDIHKSYLTAHFVRKFHKFLCMFGFTVFHFCLETRIIHQFITHLAVSLEMSFCFFGERHSLEISKLLTTTHLDL